MDLPKKEKTHTKYSHKGVKFEASESDGEEGVLEINIPKGMSYVQIRKALELAILRIR